MDIGAAASLLGAKNAVGLANAQAGFTKKAAEAERSLAKVIEQNVEANKADLSGKSGGVDLKV
ncbi:MAG: hypothetical protein AAGF58_12165 [Pseudomonadota bacterium]